MKTFLGPLCSDLKLVAMLAASLSPLALSTPAWAQTDAPSLPSFGAPAEEELDPVSDLQQQIQDLRAELQRKEEQRRRESSRLSINGYADIGFFVPLGNDGAGWRRDNGNIQLPQFSNFAWTFVGDILGTAVNTRGEPADLGDAPGVSRFDSINSDGAGGMLVNEVNLRFGYQLAERALLRTSLNFVPRSGIQDFSMGDSVDVDVAEMEYVLTADGNTSFFVGKMMPVFGIEYKERKSDQRFGITPTLVHRYTSGSQLGAKIRSKLFSEWLILAAAVSNNSSVTEPFHFYSEVDKNWGKTLSGRLAINVPMGDLVNALDGDHLEIGASGLWGPQDRASDTGGCPTMDQMMNTCGDGKTTFWGIDLQYLSSDFAIKGQFMKGDSPGYAAERVWMLDLQESGYIEADWQIFSWIGIMGRFGQRDAVVALAQERVYVTKSRQFTGGVRFVFNPNSVLKLEYVHNAEFGGIRGIKNDIATSSLVLHF
ncbi:MAG TPA: hypothetical protein VGG33_29100 [Polyangia bacterium]